MEVQKTSALLILQSGKTHFFHLSLFILSNFGQITHFNVKLRIFPWNWAFCREINSEIWLNAKTSDCCKCQTLWNFLHLLWHWSSGSLKFSVQIVYLEAKAIWNSDVPILRYDFARWNFIFMPSFGTKKS